MDTATQNQRAIVLEDEERKLNRCCYNQVNGVSLAVQFLQPTRAGKEALFK